MSRYRAAAVLVVAALAVGACTAAGGGPEDPDEPASASAATQSPALRPALVDAVDSPRVLAAASAREAALSTSAALFTEAPVVVLAAADDLAAQATAASAAVALGVPVLLTNPTGGTPDLLAQELDRLRTRTVLTVGAGAATAAAGLDVTAVTAPADAAALGGLVGADWPSQTPTPEPGLTSAAAALDPAAPVLLALDGAQPTEPQPGETPSSEPQTGGTPDAPPPNAAPPTTELPPLARATPATPTALLTTGASTDLAAVATARAAGAQVLVVPSGDPRTAADTVTALGTTQPQRTLALGATFGDDARLAARTASASTGVHLPAGGQVVFPGRRLVALYGHPGAPVLGVLGEQPLEETIARARAVAAQYQPLSDVPVVPTLEIIATVASASAGGDGDYSSETDPEVLRPWVEAAGTAGVYVLLDLQPGTTDFLTQARAYETLLVYPHVGLALDPEWRLEPGERHLEQIGSVGVDEINAVSAWLAELTRTRALPQKVLVLHQFTPSMITDRARLDMSHDELAVTIHADGNGSPGAKIASWNRLRADGPPGVWWAWKNFYDEDSPTFTPEQTYALDPRPVLVSYQ